MTKILPNMGKSYIDNPPETKNCKHCGAEAEIGGQTMWEWWEHYIKCSANCKDSRKITSGCSPVSDIIKKWDSEN